MAKKETANKPANKGFGHACKEIVRKFIVSLKRRPHYIPLAVFLVAFIVYTFHLSDISDTTAQLQGSNMGLAAFAIMLLSMLSLVCFLQAFPYRKKVNVPMLVLMLVMNAIIIFCDVYYRTTLYSMITAEGANIVITAEKNAFILYAYYYLNVHIILLVVGLVLTALLPVYSKLLRKINTNVDVEGNGDMAAIDLSAD